MKTAETQPIALLHLASGSPLQAGGRSALSVSSADAQMTAIPSLGVLVEPRVGGDSILVPWSSIRQVILEDGDTDALPAARPPAKPAEPPAVEPPPAPPAKAVPTVSAHELRAQAAKREREQLAAERAAHRAKASAAEGG